MQTRTLGKTGFEVSTISFGAWAIGADWGEVSEGDAMAALHRAVDEGVNLFDTADVYGDGRSERLLARLKRERTEELFIPTKAGRRLNPHVADGYNAENLTAFVERSLKNLETDALDLVQLPLDPLQGVRRGPERGGHVGAGRRSARRRAAEEDADDEAEDQQQPADEQGRGVHAAIMAGGTDSRPRRDGRSKSATSSRAKASSQFG